MGKLPPDSVPEIKWLEKIAILMDSRFTFPGTNFKFGLDPIIGLIPFLGNFSTMIISSSLVAIMAKRGVSRKVIILMLLNIFLDTVIGSIPLLGNIFDFGFKSNIKNIRLLKSHYYEGKYQGNGTWIIVTILLFIIALGIGILFGLYELTSFILHWMHGIFQNTFK